MERSLTPRYAIYWAPPAGSVLAELGERWLGREAAADIVREQPVFPGFSQAEIARFTADPRRYSLHATLKPPFRLAPGRRLADLESQLAAFAKTLSGFQAPPLSVARLGNFLALTLQAPSAAVTTLAANCVEMFDQFRAAPGAEELARRRQTALTPAQEQNLCRWGYPYVMEEFRFHVSLTGAIDREAADYLLPRLTAYFAPLSNTPLNINKIALFVEPQPGAPFRLIRRFDFGG
jgi:putative phosphonate metabolism protein